MLTFVPAPGEYIWLAFLVALVVLIAAFRKPRRRCPRCAEVNPRCARFCGHCGTTLDR